LTIIKKLTHVSAQTGRAASPVKLQYAIEFCTIALQRTVVVYRA